MGILCRCFRCWYFRHWYFRRSRLRKATGGSVIATASKIVVNFFHLLSPFRCLYICSAFSAQANPSNARSKQGFFLLRKQLVIDLPQGQLMDHTIADNGVPSGAGVRLGVACVSIRWVSSSVMPRPTQMHSNRSLEGFRRPCKHLMQIDLADAGPAGQLPLWSDPSFRKVASAPPSGIKTSFV